MVLSLCRASATGATTSSKFEFYQALIDVTSELTRLLVSADFDKHGHAKGDGQGEVMLWWRSHLGSARDQGLRAWDYDADLAVVHVPGCDVQQVWQSAKTKTS